MKHNKGIALIGLVLAIIILLMLSGISVYIGTDMIADTKKTTFAGDISKISDSIEEYYMVNGSIPILEGGIVHTIEEYKTKVNELEGEDAAEFLANEITSNNDANATFYEIDISKIGIDDMKLGLKDNGNVNDIYLVSNATNTVYYYLGYEVDGERFFSSIKILNLVEE